MAGSIEQRGDNRWRLRVSHGYDPVTGKRCVLRRTVEGNRAEAEQQLARLVVEASDGMWVGTSTTVADLLDAWLPQARLSPETRYDYGLVIKNQIRPNIGHVQLNKLRAHHLDALYTRLEKGGLGADRIRRCHTVLRSALKRAVKWTWIARNPAVDASPPPEPIRDIHAPAPTEYRALTNHTTAASRTDENAARRQRLLLMGVLIHLAGNIGSRRGELCGLKWTDINFEARTVWVRRTVGVVAGADYEKELKGKRRRDPIPIDHDTVELLRFWEMATSEVKNVGRNPHDWIFQAPRSGAFFRPDRVSHLFRDLADEAGLGKEIHLHSLRHYVIRQLRSAGVPLSAVSQRAGHSRQSTTSDMYDAPVDAQARQAADVIARINRGD